MPEPIRPSLHLLRYADPSATLKSVGEMDFVLSMRYQGSVFAYREKRPFTAIASDDKHRNFVKDYGRVAIELSHINTKLLMEKWNILKANSRG